MLTIERESSAHGPRKQWKVSNVIQPFALLSYGDNDKDGATRATAWTKTMTKMIMRHCSRNVSELNPSSLKHRART